MKPSVGDRLQLEISKLAHGGWGISRHEGFVVFVTGVIPGESVVAEVTSVKKSHAFAHVIDISSPSPQRIPHIWKEADVSRPPQMRAGGADFGHMSLDYQRRAKTDILREALVRFGSVPQQLADTVEVQPIDGDDSGLHWRTRVTLHVGADGRAGPYAEGTHQVIPVTTLPLATHALEDLHAHLTDWSGHHRLRLIDPSEGSPRLIVDQQTPQVIVETVGAHRFELTDHSFWQVHRLAATTLFDAVSNAISPELRGDGLSHWDLYGGVGLFARAILDGLGQDSTVTTVESDPDAVASATSNLSDAPHLNAVNAEVASFLRTATQQSPGRQRLGAVILDPPRSGAKNEVVRALASLEPRQIIYVACDPVALGRDLGVFAEHGYHPTSIQGFDLFPHTHHMEALAVLTPQV